MKTGYAAAKDGELFSAAENANQLAEQLSKEIEKRKSLQAQLESIIAQRSEVNAKLTMVELERDKVNAQLSHVTAESKEQMAANERLHNRLMDLKRELSKGRKEVLASARKGSVYSPLPKKITILSPPSERVIATSIRTPKSTHERKRRDSCAPSALPGKLTVNVEGTADREGLVHIPLQHRRQHSEWLRQAAAFAAEAIRQRGSSASLANLSNIGAARDGLEWNAEEKGTGTQPRGNEEPSKREVDEKDNTVGTASHDTENPALAKGQQAAALAQADGLNDQLAPKGERKRGHSEWYRQASVLASIAIEEVDDKEDLRNDSVGAVEEAKDYEEENEGNHGNNEGTWHEEYYEGQEWVAQTTEEGHTYFYNMKTGDAQWEDPYADGTDYNETYENYARETVNDQDHWDGRNREDGENQEHGQRKRQQVEAGSKHAELTLEQKWEAFEKEMNFSHKFY